MKHAQCYEHSFLNSFVELKITRKISYSVLGFLFGNIYTIYFKVLSIRKSEKCKQSQKKKLSYGFPKFHCGFLSFWTMKSSHILLYLWCQCKHHFIDIRKYVAAHKAKKVNFQYDKCNSTPQHFSDHVNM